MFFCHPGKNHEVLNKQIEQRPELTMVFNTQKRSSFNMLLLIPGPLLGSKRGENSLIFFEYLAHFLAYIVQQRTFVK